MKKQKIAFLLSLSWLIGLIAVFSFPPAINTTSDHHHKSELSEISTPDLVLRTSGPSPEVPAFKADFNFAGLLTSNWISEFAPSESQYFPPSFFTKSRPLFDVLITFFYFFYTC